MRKCCIIYSIPLLRQALVSGDISQALVIRRAGGETAGEMVITTNNPRDGHWPAMAFNKSYQVSTGLGKGSIEDVYGAVEGRVASIHWLLLTTLINLLSFPAHHSG